MSEAHQQFTRITRPRPIIMRHFIGGTYHGLGGGTYHGLGGQAPIFAEWQPPWNMYFVS